MYHHEHYDGTGYPSHLAGNEIPLSARIMALADVYDALSSRRCYKEPFAHEKIRDMLLAARGTHFDPLILDAFLRQEDIWLPSRIAFRMPPAPASPLMKIRYYLSSRQQHWWQDAISMNLRPDTGRQILFLMRSVPNQPRSVFINPRSQCTMVSSAINKMVENPEKTVRAGLAAGIPGGHHHVNHGRSAYISRDKIHGVGAIGGNGVWQTGLIRARESCDQVLSGLFLGKRGIIQGPWGTGVTLGPESNLPGIDGRLFCYPGFSPFFGGDKI